MRKTSLYRQPLGNPTSIAELITPNQVRLLPQSTHLGEEPYYPVNTPESAALYARYRAAADAVPGLVIGGRLGSFRYDDMDDTVARALSVKI